uniref:Conjugal transfer protein TraN n=1 Tax=Meloidogyne hapla TaxID=6305 RepID=A0A1I8B431_MELHA
SHNPGAAGTSSSTIEELNPLWASVAELTPQQEDYIPNYLHAENINGTFYFK